MSKLFFYLTIVAMFATVVTLILGIVNLFSSDRNRALKSNKLMRWRVLFQLIAILVFSSLLLFGKKHISS